MRYFLVVGEASGDVHASYLMRALQQRDPEAEFAYFGGDAMAAVAPGCICHINQLSVMGLWEVLMRLRRVSKQLSLCRKSIARFRPDAVILVDFPGFNLRVARYCKRHGFRTFYYIAPKVWAWREWRIKRIKAYVDHLVVILPFEREYFARWGVEALYEGNPLLDELPLGRNPESASEDFRQVHRLDARPIVALLPGSRRQELQYTLGIMSELTAQLPDYQFVVAAAPNLPHALYEEYMAQHTGLQIVYGATHLLLLHSVAAVVTSGTATLETALLGIPQVVVYRGNALSIALARRFVKVQWISLVNLVLQRAAVVELIQQEYRADRLLAELQRILPGGEGREAMLEQYQILARSLGTPGVAERIATRIVRQVEEGRESVMVANGGTACTD